MKKIINGLFDGIDSRSYEQMMSCFDAKERHFAPGDIISDFSERSDIIGIIKSGAAETYSIDENGNRTILETLGEGAVFGQPLSSGDDNISVVCESDASVIFIRYSHIIKRCEKACLHHSRIVENLLGMLSEKNAYLSFRVKVLSMRSIREKLLCCFRFMASDTGDNTFTLPFSLSSLADYICCDRSAMMREIKKLRDEKIIRTEKRRVTML